MINMHPTPNQIKAARKKAGLTQSTAAELIWSTLRTWQDWEAGIARMHPAIWFAFKLKSKNIAESLD